MNHFIKTSFLFLTAFASSLNAAALVGTLPGDVVVSNTGSATYSMPISLPTGVAGMAPELGITYDSSGGNGLLGMGFGLDGLSAISRTPTTLEQDGFADGIDFDSNDRFALDGQRLVCVAGTYGAAGSEYRTEIDSFVRVTAYGTASSGPDYFVVETKSGLTKTYGSTNSHSMVYDLSGNAFDDAKVSWLLEKIEDTNGNEINFTYSKDAVSESVYISEISYGASGHLLKVTFEYESRDDLIPSFLRGVSFATSKRLSGIRVFSGIAEIHRYDFVYDYSPQRFYSRLSTITFTDVATNKTMQSSFEWGDTSAIQQFTPKVNWRSATSSDEAKPLDMIGSSSTRRDIIDMNGDGLLDRVEGEDSGLSVSLHTGTGFGTKQLWYYSTKDEQNRIEWHDSGDKRSLLRDMNADGLPDKVDHYDYDNGGGRGMWVSINNGTGFDPKSNWLPGTPSNDSDCYPIDKNDGINRNLIDMNGDGLLDRVTNRHAVTEESGLWVYVNTGTGFALPVKWYVSSNSNQNKVTWTNSSGDDKSDLKDINADGLPDKIDHYDYDNGGGRGIWVSINNGSGFDPKTNWLPGTPSNDFDCYPMDTHDGIARNLIDMNGDGLLDRVTSRHAVTEESGLWVYLNTGSSFELPVKWSASSESNQHKPTWTNSSGDNKSELKDMNADGLPDKVDHYDYDNGGGRGIWVSINNGSGFDSKTNWLPGTPSNDFDCYPMDTHDGVTRNLIDMNGDGLLDRVSSRHAETEESGFWVYRNNGTGFELPVKWFASSNDDQHRVTWGSDDNKSVLKDVNGDGFPDKLDHNDYDNSAGYGIWVSLNEAKPTLLTKFTNSFGVSTEITYKPLTDKTVYTKAVNDAYYPVPSDATVTLQTPMPVVSSISKDTGIDGVPYSTEYTYAEARQHVRGRGFLGFRVFESYDVQTQLTKTEILHHDFPYTGMVISSSTYGPNEQLLSRTENTVETKALNGGLTLFPYNESSEEWKAEYDAVTNFSTMDEAALILDLETNAYGHTTTTNEFDANGNNLEIYIDYGDGYTQLTENLYAYDNVAAWYIGRLSSAKVTSTAPDTTAKDETIIRESSFTYDSNGLLLTETVEPGNALSVTTTYTRDAQGRIVTSSVDPADGPAITTETHSNLDATGRFYTNTANVLGHTETRVYDATRGWLTSQTGPNGRTTYFQYDALGRAVREDRPDGTWSTTTYALDSSQTVTNPGNGLSYTSVYSVTSTGSQSTSSTTWYDRQGRAIRACTEAFDGQIIYQDTGYNAIGQVDRVSENYYAGSTPTLWTKTTFDVLGRPNVVTAPDDTKATTIYNGRETTSIRNYQGTDTVNPNANDQTTKTLLNAKGDRQSVTSYNQANQPLLLQFRYDGAGNLLETEDSDGNTVEMTYDILGNKTGMDDPDMGIWSYTYNALGQLVTQTDAVGNITSKVYDDLGRVTQETFDAAATGVATITHNFYYDGTAEFQQLGKLHLEKSSQGGVETFRRSHYYDDLGRSFLTLSKIEGRWFYQQTDYDSYSRPVRLTHYWRPPSLDDGQHDHYLAWYSYSQETVYDSRSFVTEVKDANGQIWWDDPTYNVNGQLTSYLAGDVLRTHAEFDAATQLVERIYVDPKAGGANLLDNEYEFDSIGNLTSREDVGKSLTENFSYDNLNRLTSSAVGSQVLSMAYDDLGNITSRSNSAGTSALGHVGSYTYSTNNPHQVTAAGTRNFLYDANGSITQVTGSGSKFTDITWTAFNKPLHMSSSANKRSSFGYDTGNSRVTQTRQDWDTGQGTWIDQSRKTYVGALFEQEQTWDPTGSNWDISSTRIYISTPAGVVGSWISDLSQSDPKQTIFHRDHLGSVIAETNITATTPTIDKEFSYDAWGLARDPSNWTSEVSPTREATDRGYTGHEMLDELGLIHMNGRIYDPLLGRMLSADPHIQSPTNLQNYNRYSYVTNNPLSMTDPSGFFFSKLKKAIKNFVKKYWKIIVTVAIAVIVTIFTAGLLTGPYAGIIAGAVGGFAGGFTGTLLNGGSLGQAFTAGAFGALSGAALAGLGGGLNPADLIKDPMLALAQATDQGIVQGGIAEISGGDFGDGFVSGFSGSLAGSLVSSSKVQDGLSRAKVNNTTGRIVSAAIVGGTVTEIGGGKFANGAITAAMSAAIGEIASGPDIEKFHDDKDILDKWIYKVDNDGGEAFVYGAHGFPQGMADEKNNLMLRVDIVAEIKRHPNYDRTSYVLLCSCSTGKLDTGFASRLASDLGKPVVAPSDLLWMNKKGVSGIYPPVNATLPVRQWKPDVSKPGIWREFKPNGTVAPWKGTKP